MHVTSLLLVPCHFFGHLKFSYGSAMLFFGCAIFFSGCAMHRLEKPEVSLLDLRIGEVNLLSTSVEVDVEIQNVSAEALKISSGNHKLWLNDTYIGRGHHLRSFEVPPFQVNRETVVFRLSNISLLRQINEFVENPRLAYRIKSDLSVAGGFLGWRSLSLEEEDTLWRGAPSQNDYRPMR